MIGTYQSVIVGGDTWELHSDSCDTCLYITRMVFFVLKRDISNMCRCLRVTGTKEKKAGRIRDDRDKVLLYAGGEVQADKLDKP